MAGNVGNFQKKSIVAFRDKLIGGGARSNLFEVNISLPTGVEDPSGRYGEDIRFMTKAAEIPAANIGNIPVPFRGRVLPIAGDRTFDPWTVTIINDQTFNLRSVFEQWSNKINDLRFAGGDVNPADYQTKAEVFQLGRNAASLQNSGNDMNAGDPIPILRIYNFEGIYPNAVSSIPLDYGATDQIEEFQVTFNYLFWTVEGGVKSIAGTPKPERTGTFTQA
tara:strand:- start:66 stop:728 length:663 start_codon:yes stop_codon:yes gene_type:complete